MKTLVTLALLFFSFQAFALEIVLIGSVHKASEHYSEESLYQAIKAISPDVILTEGDDSMFDNNDRVKPGLKPLEAKTYFRLQQELNIPVINISMKDRNERMMAINYNNTLNAGFSTVQSRFDNKQLRLHEEFEGILSTFPDKNSCQDHSTLQQMNTGHCLSVVQKNYNAIFNRMGSVIRAEKDLIELSTNWEKIIAFHKLRDKSMAENIYSAIGRTKKVNMWSL
ncbi:MAG: hypothetical protein OIF51_11735 [Cellvibrionaceae bacterium]|nr:hypothetical protein [Cellvibrionaceae bacterium]